MIRPHDLWLQTHLGHDTQPNDMLKAQYYTFCYISASIRESLDDGNNAIAYVRPDGDGMLLCWYVNNMCE